MSKETGNTKIIVFPQYSNVVIHATCQEELKQLIRTTDEMAAFIASYRQRVGYLSQHLGEETFHTKWFEILSKADGLRSIRFMTFKNLRILYMLESNKAFLLLAFEERQGHRRTEYANYISPALKRFEEMERMP